jgi:hypothetical protein
MARWHSGWWGQQPHQKSPLSVYPAAAAVARTRFLPPGTPTLETSMALRQVLPISEEERTGSDIGGSVPGLNVH